MLLTIDIGNTNIVLGVFDRGKLLKSFRLSTKEFRTSDEYGIIFLDLFRNASINIQGFSGAIISCVVPPLLEPLIDTVLRYFYIEPLVVDSNTDTGVPILCDSPKEVGADRIVNAVGGYEKYREALIIVDFGTATTFDYITANGEYVGGVIAPGAAIALEALFQKTSKLPRVEIIRPARVVGKDTISSMQSGIFYGYLSLIDGIIGRMKEEVKGDPKVIATGGLAPLFKGESLYIQEIEPDLTLEGLRIIYERNQ